MMIHHCGSGTYQYQVLYKLPSITIGTGCYDREDVALRLEELGVSKHIPHPTEVVDFLSLFKNAFKSYGGLQGNLYVETKRRLSVLQEEMRRVFNSFNFEEILEYTLRKHAGHNATTF